MKTAAFVVLAFAAASMVSLAPYAYGADSQADVNVVPALEGECRIVAKCFSPDEVTIAVGGTVTWKNAGDTSQATVTSGEVTKGPDGEFDSGLIAPGAEFTHTFAEAGTYQYFSKVQPWMSGAVTVEAEGATDDREERPDTDDGGCLIATAAYGTELAPQVQLLREVRDGTILQTESGAAFMSAFNTIYYTFSPAVADLERQSPEFAGAVRLLITPMLHTLPLMSLAEQGSESHVLGLGISVIALNMGMYVAAPVAGLLIARRHLA